MLRRKAITPDSGGESTPETTEGIELPANELKITLSLSIGRNEQEPVRKAENKPAVLKIRNPPLPLRRCN